MQTPLSLRLACVAHLRLRTDVSPGYFADMSRSGVWGDGYMLQAAAVCLNTQIRAFCPWDHTFPELASAANPSRVLYLAYNGTHYDCFAPKRRKRTKQMQYFKSGFSAQHVASSEPLPISSAGPSLHNATAPPRGPQGMSEAKPQHSAEQASHANDGAAQTPMQLHSSDFPSDWFLNDTAAQTAWEQLPNQQDFAEWAAQQRSLGRVTLTSYNVTAFLPHEAYLSDLPTSILLAQEVGCTHDAMVRLSHRLTQKHWSVVLGPAPPSKQFGNRASDVAALGGLLMAASEGGVTSAGQPLPCNMQIPRLQVARWVLSGLVVFVINVYGFAGDMHQDELNNCVLQAQVWEFVATLGAVPIVVAGDFNSDVLLSHPSFVQLPRRDGELLTLVEEMHLIPQLRFRMLLRML